MNTPRSFLRMGANHIVDASRLPCIGCQGRGGFSSARAIPASTSWRWVAT